VSEPHDQPGPATRRKRNSNKVNLTISVVFHTVVAALLAFWAAHEGVLGTRLKEFTAVIVPPEKKPEPPKQPEPKEIPKPEEPPPAAVAKVDVPPPAASAAPPPAAADVTAAAPAANSLADFSFSDGAKVVETSTNAPALYYKNLLEYTLRSNWERPANLNDDNFVAEIEIEVDNSGRLLKSQWAKKSGVAAWDDSVSAALAKTRTVNRAPPTGFPPRFVVRFDVLPATVEPISAEPVLQ
jgi:hypothetical protein